MRFKNYVALQEVLDVADADVSQVHFYSPDGSAVRKHDFQYGGQRYEMSFLRCPLYMGKYMATQDSVEISFIGPKKYELTGMGNSASIYSLMLKSIKAYIAKYRPEGLQFVGANSAMDLIYAAFVNRFLSDKPGKHPSSSIYLQINESEYIRKDLYEDLESPVKEIADDLIGSWAKRKSSYLADKRQHKNNNRKPIPSPLARPIFEASPLSALIGEFIHVEGRRRCSLEYPGLYLIAKLQDNFLYTVFSTGEFAAVERKYDLNPSDLETLPRMVVHPNSILLAQGLKIAAGKIFKFFGTALAIPGIPNSKRTELWKLQKSMESPDQKPFYPFAKPKAPTAKPMA